MEVHVIQCDNALYSYAAIKFADYIDFTSWMTVLGQRVDDDRVLLLVRYEKGREAILYRPTNNESALLLRV
jgi:hypothetical protein